MSAAGAQAPVQVAAFYRFTAMAELPDLRDALQALAAAEQVRGTILLAEEGVNGTISGPQAGVQRLLGRLRQCPGLAPLEAKVSWAPQQAFHRLKVRLKREIVTMGCPTVKPAEQVGTYVSPQQWDALIRDPDTLVVDTRNAYEVAVGTFAGAIDPGTESFREFPAWVDRELRPLVEQRQPKAIAMFCTGGIRCEKSTAFLKAEGIEDVYHLQGGILKYLETVPAEESLWEGECFVFDQRVTVGHGLREGTHTLCHACRRPILPEDRARAEFEEGVSCHHCADETSEADKARFRERQKQIALSGK